MFSNIVPTWKIAYANSPLDVAVADTVISVYADVFGVEFLASKRVVINLTTQPSTYYIKRFVEILDFHNLICLSVESSGRWAQLIYQLAHELSHVIMGCYPIKPQLQKVSETFCCAAAFYVMEQIRDIKWNAAPLLRNTSIADSDIPYLDSFTDYVLSESLRHLKGGYNIEFGQSVNGITTFKARDLIYSNPTAWTAIKHLSDEALPFNCSLQDYKNHILANLTDSNERIFLTEFFDLL